MSRSDDERVADILEAADELALVVDVGREAFAASPLHRRAAERLLEIIGEASTALTDGFKASHPEVAWRDVGALRILLAHNYHRIDLDQVWQIAAVSVPDLVRHLRNDDGIDFSSNAVDERLSRRRVLTWRKSGIERRSAPVRPAHSLAAVEASESVTIASAGRGIEFGRAEMSASKDPYAGDAFTARLFAEGLSVSRRVFMFRHDWLSLAGYFTGLAERWRGFEGEVVWESPEHDLEIRATSDGLGHHRLAFELRDGPVWTWSAQVLAVEIAAGEDCAALSKRVAAWSATP